MLTVILPNPAEGATVARPGELVRARSGRARWQGRMRWGTWAGQLARNSPRHQGDHAWPVPWFPLLVPGLVPRSNAGPG